jgi:peptidoglycan/xylan/chitin deacetylase (PgdA/CDA1 family)
MNLVLCYHHVSPSRRLYSTAPDEFERHLQALRRAGFAFLSHQEFTDLAARQFASKARTVLLTFDDGHADNWFHARPILQGLDIPAVMFAISSAVASGPPRQPSEEPQIDGTPQSEEMLMPIRWSELRAWQETGLLSIQTHTHRHRPMREFDGSPQELEALMVSDLTLAVGTLKEQVGQAPTSIAWPWGYSNSVMRSAAAAQGLQLQFSVVPGFNGSWSAQHRLHRVCVDGASAAEVTAWATKFRARQLAALYSLARLGYNAAKGALMSSRPQLPATTR